MKVNKVQALELKDYINQGQSNILQAGEYYVSSQLSLQSNTTIEGEGVIIKGFSKGTIENPRWQYPTKILINIVGTNVKFKGLTFSGNNKNSYGAIHGRGYNGLTIEDCEFQGFWFAGVWLTNFDNIQIKNNKFYDNTSGDSGNSTWSIGIGNSKDVLIEGNEIEEISGGAGLGWIEKDYSPVKVENWNIRGNYIKVAEKGTWQDENNGTSSPGHALSLDPGNGGTPAGSQWINVVVENNELIGQISLFDRDVGSSTDSPNSIAIRNNYFSYPDDWQKPRDPIECLSSGVTIEGNRFEGVYRCVANYHSSSYTLHDIKINNNELVINEDGWGGYLVNISSQIHNLEYKNNTAYVNGGSFTWVETRLSGEIISENNQIKSGYPDNPEIPTEPPVYPPEECIPDTVTIVDTVYIRSNLKPPFFIEVDSLGIIKQIIIK